MNTVDRFYLNENLKNAIEREEATKAQADAALARAEVKDSPYADSQRQQSLVAAGRIQGLREALRLVGGMS